MIRVRGFYLLEMILALILGSILLGGFVLVTQKALSLISVSFSQQDALPLDVARERLIKDIQNVCPQSDLLSLSPTHMRWREGSSDRSLVCDGETLRLSNEPLLSPLEACALAMYNAHLEATDDASEARFWVFSGALKHKPPENPQTIQIVREVRACD